MANNLGSLVVSLGLDAAEFTRGLSKSEYQQQQWARRVETSIEAARTGALAAFAAIGTAAAVLDRQLEGIAGFQDLADKMGDTAEQVASLKLALDVSGTSADTAAAASVKLTAALAKAGDESKGAALGLKAIGLEVESFRALSPVAQLDAVAQALAGFEDGAEKTAVAVQLFGKSGADLIPLFNDLAEQGGRQVTLTQAQIAAADEYSKTTARLRSELQTLVQVTAADAAPVMQQMVQILRDVTTFSTSAGNGFSLMGALMEGAKVALQTVVVLGSDVAFVFKQVGNEIGGMAAQIVALATLDFSGFNAISKAMKEDAARARAELDTFQKNILNPVTFGADDQSDAEARRLGLTRPRGVINTRGFSGSSGSSSARGATGKTEAQKREEQFEQDRLDYAKAEDANRQRLFNKRLDEQERAERDHLDFIAQYEIDQANYVQDRHAKRLEEEEKTREELAKKALQAQEDQAKRLGDAFSSTFDRMFTEGMKFGDLLKKLAYDAINIQLLTPATQKIGSSLGGAVSSLFGGFFADGGYLPPGQWGIAGERGPEPIFGGKTGLTIQPAGGGGGNTAVINQSFNFGNATADTVAQLRAEAARIKAETLAAVPAAMVQAVRTSTGVARAMRGG